MLKLNGLRVDNPQGWMAAVGLMRILHLQNQQVSIYWLDGRAVLSGIEENDLLASLMEYLEKGSRLLSDLESLPVNDKQKIALDFTAGRVNFRAELEAMLTSVTEKDISKALFQPWENKHNVVSLGWDPSAVKQAARFAGSRAPDSAKHQTELAGQWLASESLYITCPDPGSLREYRWVNWQYPLDYDSVVGVIQARDLSFDGEEYSAQITFNGSFKVFRQGCRTAA